MVKIACAYLFGLYQRSHLLKTSDLLKRVVLSSMHEFSDRRRTDVGQLAALDCCKALSRVLIILIDLAFTVLVLGISRFIFYGLAYRSDPSSSNSE